MYSNIPKELQDLNQWICWKLEDIGAKKPTKIPYSINGNLASVNNPNSWCNFKQAVDASCNYSGIGFVFTDNDPYTFIDLDDTAGDQAALDRQIKIFQEFDSYSEISPSGNGLHIIVKGIVPAGRRRSFIEVYSSQRYATFTGNVYGNKFVINERQQLLTQLWEQMGSGPVAISMYKGDDKERYTDEEIVKQAKNAQNSVKFECLYNGEWNTTYQSQSEADFALIDIISFYTQNRNQISRIFRSSKLGVRAKANRQDYLAWMINKSFDRMLPPIDLDGFQNQLELKLVELKNVSNNSKCSGDFIRFSNSQNTEQQSNNITCSSDARISQGMEETQSRENQNSSSTEQQKEISQSSEMDSGVQSQIKMSLLPGNSSGMSGLSSQRPYTENEKNFLTSSSHYQYNNERNSEVRRDMQQLSSEVALQRAQKEVKIPPGLLGEIAQFIYASAQHPVPEIALAGALALMAGITGRAYNISGTGLNQYILLIANTGAGKEAMAYGIDKLMNAIHSQVPMSANYIGPAEIASGQALVKHINKHSQCFVSILGEFGLRLQSMSSQYASSSEIMLKRILLDVYNKSGFGQQFRGSIFADRDKNIAETQSPAMTLLGESTPERFYGVLNEDMISEGLLPRFSIIEYNGPVTPLNKNSISPSFQLVEKFASLVAQCESITHASPKRVINVQYNSEAEKMLDQFEEYARNLINGTDKEITRQLWNRAHIKSLKISALIAVGVNSIHPVIMPDYVSWAINMVQSDIRALSSKFEQGLVGVNSSEIKQQLYMIRIIKDFISRDWEHLKQYASGSTHMQALHQKRIIPYSFISKRLISMASFRNDKQGSTAAIKRTLQTLIDSGKLQEVNKQALVSLNTLQKCYVIIDAALIE